MCEVYVCVSICQYACMRVRAYVCVCVRVHAEMNMRVCVRVCGRARARVYQNSILLRARDISRIRQVEIIKSALAIEFTM